MMLENLRQRPEEERVAVAALAAGFVGLVLFLLWGATFFTGGSKATYAAQSQTATALSASEATTELSKVIGEFSGQYAELRSALESAQFSDEEVGTPVVDVSVNESGEVEVQNVIVGPTRE